MLLTRFRKIRNNNKSPDIFIALHTDSSLPSLNSRTVQNAVKCRKTHPYTGKHSCYSHEHFFSSRNQISNAVIAFYANWPFQNGSTLRPTDIRIIKLDHTHLFNLMPRHVDQLQHQVVQLVSDLGPRRQVPLRPVADPRQPSSVVLLLQSVVILADGDGPVEDFCWLKLRTK